MFLLFFLFTFVNVNAGSNIEDNCDKDSSKLLINDVTDIPGSCKESKSVSSDVRGANKLKKLMEKESKIQVSNEKKNGVFIQTKKISNFKIVNYFFTHM